MRNTLSMVRGFGVVTVTMVVDSDQDIFIGKELAVDAFGESVSGKIKSYSVQPEMHSWPMGDKPTGRLVVDVDLAR